MFFNKKTKPPLHQALNLVQQASEIIMRHKRDKNFKPNERDLKLLQRIDDELRNTGAVASYVCRCMQQRKEGKAEGATKFNDPEVFEYHYPDR